MYYFLFTILISSIQCISFCHIYCNPNSCNSQLQNDCNSCTTHFILQSVLIPSSCIFDDSNNTIVLSKIKNDFQTNQNKYLICSNLTIFGKFQGQIIFRAKTPISNPHYEIKIVIVFILIDYWNTNSGGDFIDIVDIDSYAPTIRIQANASNTLKQYCQDTDLQKYLRYQTLFFSHTTFTQRVRLRIIPRSSSRDWGIMDAFIVSKLCHSFCKVCYGPTYQQCSQCILPRVLSSTICADNCLPGYGIDISTPSICIQCQSYCYKCENILSNCSVCWNTTNDGLNFPIYSVQGQNRCVINCPVGYILYQTVCVINCPTGWGPNALLTVCLPCHQYCSNCNSLATNCTFCYSSITVLSQNSTIFMLQNQFTCVKDQCPLSYFQFIGSPYKQCRKCHIYCLLCSESSTNCTQCNKNLTQTGVQVLKVQDQNLCTISCDSPTYFPDILTNKCLLCSLHCINLQVDTQLINNKLSLQFVFKFQSDMDFSNFNYNDFMSLTLSDPTLSLTNCFIVIYNLIDSRSFKLTINPKCSINFEKLNVCAITKQQSNTLLSYAKNGYKLSPSVYQKSTCEVWSLPLQFYIYQKEQIQYLINFQNMNKRYQQFKTQKGVQQLFKSGIFSLLAPGAQLSSTIILHNIVLSRNLYEGTRFWASFVYFDVPQFQLNSQKTKYVFNQPNYQLIQKIKGSRLLQKASSAYINQFRFQRTGHTGFFIYDTYLQIFMILGCWIMIFIGWYYQKKTNSLKSKAYKIRCKINTIFHKLHELSFFYLVLSAITEYRNFTQTTMHYVSVIFSLIFLFYYLCYQLKIYYDLIEYPLITIKTYSFQKILKGYSFFLAYYRFQQYKDKTWNWRHFLRPYNYHSITFIKKSLMLISIPIFYDSPLTSILILMVLQIFDVIRFLLTIPFSNNIRNINYFILQLFLMIFFICTYINQSLSNQMYDSLKIQIINIQFINSYKASGWTAMIILYIYNIQYLISSIIQFMLILFKKNYLQKEMQKNRRQYYLKLFDHFQQYGCYYRLVRNYTQQLKYNHQRKSQNKFIDFVNQLHQAEPIIDLSGSKYQVFKNIVEKGDLFNIYSNQDQLNLDLDQKLIQIKIQTFIITNIKKRLYLNIENSAFDQLENKINNNKGNSKTVNSKKNLNKQQNNNDSENVNLNYQVFNFNITYNIITQIFKSYKKKQSLLKYKNNYDIKIENRLKDTIKSQQLNINFLKSLNNLILSFKIKGAQQIKLTTYMKIQLGQYQEGQLINFIKQNMRQQIQLKIVKNQKIRKQIIKLNKLFDGFPIDWNNLIKFKKNQQIQQQTEKNKYYDNKQQIRKNFIKKPTNVVQLKKIHYYNQPNKKNQNSNSTNSNKKQYNKLPEQLIKNQKLNLYQIKNKNKYLNTYNFYNKIEKNKYQNIF